MKYLEGMQIIRIRDLVLEHDLNNIWFPIDKDTYSSNAKKISINDLITIVLSGSTIAPYINPNPVPETIGGVEVGTTFPSPGKTMQQMWDLLLYPYQYPSFTLFNFQNHTGTIEIGEFFLTDIAYWTISNSFNVSANTIAITGYNLTGVTGLSNLGSYLLTFTSTVTRTSGDGRGDRSWTISAKNTKNMTFSDTMTITWDWMWYWGTSALTGLTGVQIQALSNSNLYSEYTRTYSFVAGDYKYLCFADEYGGPSNFVDALTGFQVAIYDGYPNIQNGFNYDLVSVTNSYSQTTQYRVYRTKNTLGGNINIIVT